MPQLKAHPMRIQKSLGKQSSSGPQNINRNLERKVPKLLTDEKLVELKNYLGQDHFIDCLFILHLDYGTWGKATDFARLVGFHLSFSCYRSRMKDLEKLGFATCLHLDSKKKRYALTKSGETLARALLAFFEGIEICHK